MHGSSTVVLQSATCTVGNSILTQNIDQNILWRKNLNNTKSDKIQSFDVKSKTTFTVIGKSFLLLK